MAVADAAARNPVADIIRQRRDERTGQITVAVERGKCALLAGQRDRRTIRGMADRAHRLGGEFRRGAAVVAQPEHHQRVRQPGDAQADAARLPRDQTLPPQREARHIDHVVQQPHRVGNDLQQPVLIQPRMRA